MDKFGSDGTPFVFLSSFSGERNLVLLADEACEQGLCLDMPGFRNHRLKSISGKAPELKVFPVEFERYREAFELVRAELLYGNSFLLNLTFPSRIECNMGLEELFTRGRAPFRLMLKDELVVFSPERFVQIRDGVISSNPMKGTRDAASPGAYGDLASDPKEDAEHHTIVDLIRNDLSMVASRVRVKRFKYIERIRTHNGELLQMSSEITGQLPSDHRSRLGEILFSLLPAGSISGAPKQKTLQIIHKAEGYDRGFYTGVFGYFDGCDLDSAVAIRYMEKRGDELWFKSGGGITYQSDAEQEYQELIKKIYVPLY